MTQTSDAPSLQTPARETVSEILSALKKGLPNRAVRKACSLFAGHPVERAVITRVIDMFTEAGQAEGLSKMLIAERDWVFKDLFLTATLMQLVGPRHWRKELAPLLDRHLAGGACGDYRFGEEDALKSFARLHVDQFAQLTRMKYFGWSRCESAKALFATAERNNAAFLLEQRPTDFLFGHSRFQHLGRLEWERRLRTAQLAKHYVADQSFLAGAKAKANAATAGEPAEALRRVFADLALTDILVLMDPAETERVFAQIGASAPMLLCTFHGAYLRLTQTAYKQLMLDHYTIAKRTSEGLNIIGTQDSRQSAAFMAVKALMKSKIVLIVADGIKSRTLTVNVLGKPRSLPGGAPFIAHAARCKTGWYTVLRGEDGFVPEFEYGPAPDKGEREADFSARWVAFYEAHIQDHFSGSPDNIVMSSPWSDYWRK